jgi:RNA polymerase sigma-70 factor (ECF subfamily)
MLKVKTGDILAFEEIMKKYEKSVINTIYRFIGSRIRAEEMAQEVFIKIYISAKRYRPKAKFSTWLYKIVTNICLDELRKKKNISNFSLHSEIPDPHQNPLDKNLEKKVADCSVREAIYSLPYRQRIAVILREYNGLTYKEISITLKCSTKAVESLLYHAKLSLKEKLMPQFKQSKI